MKRAALDGIPSRAVGDWRESRAQSPRLARLKLEKAGGLAPLCANQLLLSRDSVEAG